MVGTLHPEAVAQIRLAQYTEEQLLEEVGRRAMARAGDPPTSLGELAKKYGTDKGPAEHNYTPLYDNKFWLHRYDELTLLELGIWRGASVRMWREYFTNATIIGLDRHAAATNALQRDDIVTVKADQNDSEAINELGSLYGPLHIVIDDASHISSKTIQSFRLLWPHVAPGGIYVIEDLQTSYDPAHYGHHEANVDPDADAVVQGTELKHRTAMGFCKRLADEVNHGLYPAEYWLGFDIASVEFHLNICFITKAGKWSAQ